MQKLAELSMYHTSLARMQPQECNK